MRERAWPIGIVVALVLFMGMTVMYATRAFRERVDLVTPDYYYRDKEYSDRLVRENELLKHGTPTVRRESGALRITLPAFFAGKSISGKLDMYSPMNPAEDYSRQLKFTGTTVSVPINISNTKRWRASFNFNLENKSYFFEQAVE
jgi:hypothetical protein